MAKLGVFSYLFLDIQKEDRDKEDGIFEFWESQSLFNKPQQCDLGSFARNAVEWVGDNVDGWVSECSVWSGTFSQYLCINISRASSSLYSGGRREQSSAQEWSGWEAGEEVRTERGKGRVQCTAVVGGTGTDKWWFIVYLSIIYMFVTFLLMKSCGIRASINRMFVALLLLKC